MAARDNLNNDQVGQYNMFTGDLDPVQPSAPLPEIAKREKQEEEERNNRSFNFAPDFGTSYNNKDFVWTGPRLYHGGSFHIKGGIVKPSENSRYDMDVAFSSSSKNVASGYADHGYDPYNKPRLFTYIHEVEPMDTVEREDKGSSVVAAPSGYRVVNTIMRRYDGKYFPEKKQTKDNDPKNRVKPSTSPPDFNEVTINGKTMNRNAARSTLEHLESKLASKMSYGYGTPSKKDVQKILEHRKIVYPDEKHTFEDIMKEFM